MAWSQLWRVPDRRSPAAKGRPICGARAARSRIAPSRHAILCLWIWGCGSMPFADAARHSMASSIPRSPGTHFISTPRHPAQPLKRNRALSDKGTCLTRLPPHFFVSLEVRNAVATQETAGLSQNLVPKLPFGTHCPKTPFCGSCNKSKRQQWIRRYRALIRVSQDFFQKTWHTCAPARDFYGWMARNP